MSDDPRMAMTLRDVEKYFVIPRHHALTIWDGKSVIIPLWQTEELFDPIFYPGAQRKCSPSD